MLRLQSKAHRTALTSCQQAKTQQVASSSYGISKVVVTCLKRLVYRAYKLRAEWSRVWWAGWLSRYSDWLRAGRSGIESRWGRDFPPVQTGPGAHAASCTMGTGSFPGVEAAGPPGWPPPHLVPKVLEKSRAIPLLTLRTFVAYKKAETYPTAR